MPVYALKKQNDAFLTVQIGTELYRVPLKQSMKHSDVRKLVKLTREDDKLALYDFMCDMFEKYIPASVMDNLEEGEIDNLFELWQNGVEQVEGVPMGESSPSAVSSTSMREPLITTSSPEPDTQ